MSSLCVVGCAKTNYFRYSLARPGRRPRCDLPLPCTRSGCSAAPASRARHKCSQAHLDIVFKVFSPSVADAREHRGSSPKELHATFQFYKDTLLAYLKKAIDSSQGTCLCRPTWFLPSATSAPTRAHTWKYTADTVLFLSWWTVLFKFLEFKAEWFICIYISLPNPLLASFVLIVSVHPPQKHPGFFDPLSFRIAVFIPLNSRLCGTRCGLASWCKVREASYRAISLVSAWDHCPICGVSADDV